MTTITYAVSNVKHLVKLEDVVFSVMRTERFVSENGQIFGDFQKLVKPTPESFPDYVDLHVGMTVNNTSILTFYQRLYGGEDRVTLSDEVLSSVLPLRSQVMLSNMKAIKKGIKNV